jgi:MFS family permease
MNRGWPLVWALSAAQLVSWGSIYYSFSLCVVPMENELGWSRASLNGALSLGLLASGLVAYPIGARIDRHGGRAVMTLGSLAGMVLFLAWSRVDSLALFYAIWLGLGLARRRARRAAPALSQCRRAGRNRRSGLGSRSTASRSRAP